jgi:hypothetical protein
VVSFSNKADTVTTRSCLILLINKVNAESCNWFPLGHAMGLFPLKFNSNTLCRRKNSEIKEHELNSSHLWQWCSSLGACDVPWGRSKNINHVGPAPMSRAYIIMCFYMYMTASVV